MTYSKKYFFSSIILIIVLFILQLIYVKYTYIFTDDVLNEFAWYKALKSENLLLC